MITDSVLLNSDKYIGLLQWSLGGVAAPHPLEWVAHKRGSFKPEYKLVEQIDGVLRPYVTIPTVLPQDPTIEYPVTYFARSGSPCFFLSNDLFEVYRSEFNATKYFEVYYYLSMTYGSMNQ